MSDTYARVMRPADEPEKRRATRSGTRRRSGAAPSLAAAPPHANRTPAERKGQPAEGAGTPAEATFAAAAAAFTAGRDAQAGHDFLFEDVAALLRRSAAEHPLLLVIDDLQWADTASLLLLRFIARNVRGSRLLVTGTYRDVEIGEPLRELLGTTAGLHEHVQLEGLSQSEVAHLVGSLTGVDPSAKLAAAPIQLVGTAVEF